MPPTATGAETVDEALERLRGELVRVRQTIERHELNGQSFSLRGTAVTQVAYERALKREKDLERRISALEARLAGRPAPGVGQFRSRGEDA